MAREPWATRVSNPPQDRPILIYDGDCSFCRSWVLRIQIWAGERMDYQPYQAVLDTYPEIPKEQFQRSVHYIGTDGAAAYGAKAVFLALSHAPGFTWFWLLYTWLPGFAPLAEWGYRLVANHRPFFDKLMIRLIGRSNLPATYQITRALFLKSLAVVYLMAFVSLWVQIDALIGGQGLLPAADYLETISQNYGGERYYLLPTLAWFNAEDWFLHGLCLTGVLTSILLLAGLAPALCLLILYIGYLSLVSVGQLFLAYQWDTLLLEAGFLAVFFAPWRRRTRLQHDPVPSRLLLWALWFLLFRLMFSSGMVKLLSGDAAWANLTALLHHYETQPLTNWVAWYVHQLPEWFHKLSCALMFFIELAVPFLIFTPRRPRLFACVSLIGLQVLIIITGNYGFFNYLAIGLCLLLIDDVYWRKVLPPRWQSQECKAFQNPHEALPKRVINGAVVILVVFLGVGSLYLMRFRGGPGTEMMASTLRAAQPFKIVNNYGLFAVMTKKRPEIIIQGSRDGEEWKEYEFFFKAGDLARAPQFVAPHMPRLDWQMWFAALEDYRRNRWLIRLQEQLLLGNPTVLEHFRRNPFPDHPPAYIRAVLYDYQFTSWEERRETGHWWKRRRLGNYTPPLRLRGGNDKEK